MLHEQQVLSGISARLAATGIGVPAPIVSGRPGFGYPWSWSGGRRAGAGTADAAAGTADAAGGRTHAGSGTTHAGSGTTDAGAGTTDAGVGR